MASNNMERCIETKIRIVEGMNVVSCFLMKKVQPHGSHGQYGVLCLGRDGQPYRRHRLPGKGKHLHLRPGGEPDLRHRCHRPEGIHVL